MPSPVTRRWRRCRRSPAPAATCRRRGPPTISSLAPDPARPRHRAVVRRRPVAGARRAGGRVRAGEPDPARIRLRSHRHPGGHAPAEAFRQRRGVCQDFAQIMITGLRAAGIPAAYASGYIRTLPPPGQARLVGADATHAWVLIWCGPDHGWVGVDPTNGIWMAGDHIIVAVGRDYAEIAPVDGVVLGSGAQKMEVSVDVAPVEELAPITGTQIATTAP
ncbi:transglutaminase family protein [Sphingomonas sp. I4]